MEALERLLNPAVVWVLIPIVAIVAPLVVNFQKNRWKHEERMAKIAAGIDPDAEYIEVDEDGNRIEDQTDDDKR